MFAKTASATAITIEWHYFASVQIFFQLWNFNLRRHLSKLAGTSSGILLFEGEKIVAIHSEETPRFNLAEPPGVINTLDCLLCAGACRRRGLIIPLVAVSALHLLNFNLPLMRSPLKGNFSEH
ncbi:hypothetical protein AVEN_101370-1 [Araneus ventricosus]|uniref:Uncharacterized protein n=1 Tax=Araneus ventricosus TaxID=182803 RepID=A0A4Y2WEB1_ARAVE|nr:hypothetical protein AVEN_101370-1 [Araneus ventricosus]